jgi:DNA repair exonuclease SbcCD ATPase subunit
MQKIKIKGFRGFNAEQEINLDSEVVLVYGLNGSGKSSLTEAIEWLFFDDIARKKLSPCKSEYRYEDYLRNLFYTDSENPFVEVEGTIKGRQIKIRKELITEKEYKYFLNGSEVKDFSSIPLTLDSYSRPMLAQTEIAALVNTEQKDRWEQLSYILGLEDLTKLRQHLIETRNTKKDKQYKKIEREFDGLSIDLSRTEELAVLHGVFESLDIKEITNSIKELIVKEGIDVSKENYSGAIKIKLGLILGSDLAKRVVELKVSLEDFEEWFANIKHKLDELESLVANISKKEVDLNKIDFLSKGKKIAKIPECPFCVQKTLTDERMQEINKELSLADNVVVNKNKCDNLIRTISHESDLTRTKEELKSNLPLTQELKIIAQKLADLDLKDLAGKVQTFEREVDSFLSDGASNLSTQIATNIQVLENFYFHNEKSVVPGEAKKILLKTFENILKIASSFTSQWITLRDEIIKPFTSPSASTQKEVEKWILIDKINNFVIREMTFLKKRKLIWQIDIIQSKLESFEKKEVNNLLIELSDEIKDYYNRLNPGEEMLFKKIEVRDGVRRQARLIAEAYGKEINPVTIFSEAHTNSLSLSIYFPQRVDRNPTWEVVILDDPVQSMDQHHSFSLIEILSKVSQRKQVIVLTHAKSFADDFACRFDANSILLYDFFSGGEEGPSVRIKHGKTLDYLIFVQKNYNGNQVERESAGNALRKAIASVCGEILLKKGRALSKIRSFERTGFDKLLNQLEREKIDTDDINKLKVLLNQGHADSHVWSVRDTTPTGLCRGVENVREVYSKYVVEK